MSQRTIGLRPAAPPTAPAPAVRPASARREALVRAIAAVGTIALMVAIAYDLLTGGWVGAAGLHVALALVAVALWLPAARKVRSLHLCLIYVFGLFVYTVLRSFADQTFIPVRSTYVIDIDRALFFGHLPTQWLQARLFDPTRLRPLDWLTVQVHWSYFAVPHVAAVAVYVWRRDLFPQFVALVLGTFYAGLMLYFLVPTVPPWLAADHGLLPGVSRVMDFVGGRIDPDNYRRLYDAIGVANPVAAMPSLHMAVTFAVFLFARRINRWLGRVLLIYAVVMGFSLVYMGEHYAADVLAGVLVAGAVYQTVRRLSPPGHVRVRS
jgi:membrane-associated phospholipid phosphatase